MSALPFPQPLPQPLPPSLLTELHTSDASLYPSPLPLSLLKSWLAAAPSFSHLYGLSTSFSAVIIALPIALRHWNNVVSGELREWEIQPSMITVEPGAEVGIHVWHVEGKGYGKVAYEGVVEEAKKKQLEVRGWSALCVTEDGVLWAEKRGWREGEYKGQVAVEGKGLIERREWDGRGMEEGWAKMLYKVLI